MPLRSTHFTPACIAFIKQWQGLSLEKYHDKKGIADMRICEAFIHKEMTQIKDRFQLEVLITWIFSVGITQFCAKNIWPVFISQPEIF